MREILDELFEWPLEVPAGMDADRAQRMAALASDPDIELVVVNG